MTGGRGSLPSAGRRGLSMIGSIVFLSLFSLSTALVADVVSGMIHALSVQSEARSLSRLADAARNHAARNPTQLMNSIRSDPDEHILFTAADLQSTGWLAPGEELRTTRRREVHLAAAAASPLATEERIVLLAWTAEGGGRPALPRAGPGITHVGRVGSAVDGCGADHVCGAGLRWDASGIFGLLAPPPAAGAMAALRLVHYAADRDPYLHRSDVGAALVNRVEGNFDMGGHGIAGTTGAWTVRELEVGGSVVSAGVQFGDVVVARRTAVTGDAAVGNIDAARVTAGGDQARPGLVVNGLSSIGRLGVSDRIGAASWNSAPAAAFSSEQLEIAGRLTLAGRLRVEDSWPPGSPLPPATPRISATQVEVGRLLEAETAGAWGSGELSFEIADVNAEMRMGSLLRLERGGTGLVDVVDAPACTGCQRILAP